MARKHFSVGLRLLIATIGWMMATVSADMEPIAFYPMEGNECMNGIQFEDKTDGQGLGLLRVGSNQKVEDVVTSNCNDDTSLRYVDPRMRKVSGGTFMELVGWLNTSVPFEEFLRKSNTNEFSLEFWVTNSPDDWSPRPGRNKNRLFTIGRADHTTQASYQCMDGDFSMAVYFEVGGTGDVVESLSLMFEVRPSQMVGACYSSKADIDLSHFPFGSKGFFYNTFQIVVSMSVEKGWMVFLTQLKPEGLGPTFAYPIKNLPNLKIAHLNQSHRIMLGGDPSIARTSPSSSHGSWQGDFFAFAVYKTAFDLSQVEALAKKNVFLGADTIPGGKEGRATSFKPMSDFMLERFNKYASGEKAKLLEVQGFSTRKFPIADARFRFLPEVTGKLYLGKEPFNIEQSTVVVPPFTFDPTKETLFFYPDDLDAFGGLVEVTLKSAPPQLGKSWTKSMIAFIEAEDDPPVLEMTPSKETRVAVVPSGIREPNIYRIHVKLSDIDCPNTEPFYTSRIQLSEFETWFTRCSISGIRSQTITPNLTYGSLYYTSDPDGCSLPKLAQTTKLPNKVLKTLPFTSQGATHYICYHDECAALGCPGLEDGKTWKEEFHISATDGSFITRSITHELILDNGLRPAEPVRPAIQVSVGTELFEFKLTGLDLACEDGDGVKLPGPPSFLAACEGRKKQFVINSIPPESQGVLYLTQDLASAITQEQLGEKGLLLAQGVDTLFFRPAKSYFNRERWPLCDPSGKVSLCPDVGDTATCVGPQRDTRDPLSCLVAQENGSLDIPSYTVQDLSGNLLGGCDALVAPTETHGQYLSSGCPISFKYSLQVLGQTSTPVESQRAWIVNAHKSADLVSPIQEKLQVSANEQVPLKGKESECVTIDTHGEGDVRVLQVDISLRGDGLLHFSSLLDLDEKLIQYTVNGDKREEGADKFSLVGVASAIQVELCALKVSASRGDIKVTFDLSDVAESRKGSRSQVTVVSRSIDLFVPTKTPSATRTLAPVDSGSPELDQTGKDPSTSTPTGAIVGATVGSVAALGAVAFAVIYYKRYKSSVDDSRLSVTHVP